MSLLYTAHVPAGDGPFPTILSLHGWGASAHDLLGLAPLLHGGNALVLCPQGPVSFPVGGGAHGYGWFPLVPGTAPDPGAFRRGVEALWEFLDQGLERYPIDRERLVVMGFSQGGAMAYALALEHPERFAGAAALSSWLPANLAEQIPHQSGHEGFPVLILHGTRDTMLEIHKARESRDNLRAFGVALTYREFEMGHEISREALRVLTGWLDERALAPQSA
jgi:phospholipase/carboxylesterase